jgi:hypothetical protein
MGVVHWLLIAANAIIIAGGSVLAGDSNTVSSAWSDSDNVKTAKGMRAAGQAIFLLINVVLAYWFVVTLRQYRSRYSSSPFYGHPTLAILMATWPFLFIRGVFGVCQAAIDNLNVGNKLKSWGVRSGSYKEDIGLTPMSFCPFHFPLHLSLDIRSITTQRITTNLVSPTNLLSRRKSWLLQCESSLIDSECITMY